MAQDSLFTSQIASLTSGLILSANELIPGSISSISVSYAGPTTVQAASSYQFTFTPDHSLLPSSLISINLPTLISIGDGTQCTLSFPTAQYFNSSSASCTYGSQSISIQNPFSQTYPGGQPLIVVVSTIVNPISIKSSGNFTLSTYQVASGQAFIVD